MNLTELAQNYCSVLNPQKPTWFEDLIKQGGEEKIPIVSEDVGEFLKLVCLLKKPEYILEIGSGIGCSTHWMLLGFNNAKITALDMNQYRMELAEQYLIKSGFKKNVTLIRSWAEDFLDQNQQKFDLVFLDSVKKDYINLLEPILKILNPGGVLVADNIFYNSKVLHLSPEQEKKYRKGVESLKAFNQKAANYRGLNSVFLPVGDGLLVAEKVA